MKEVWKDIKGYEGLYQVSNLGRIRNFDKYIHTKLINNEIVLKKRKIMKQSITWDGYLRVTLTKNKKHKSIKVHRLVAEAFIPNYNEYPQVNHKDENKLNNCVNNLEWCSNEYNYNYGTRKQRASQSKKKMIRQYDKNNNLIKEWKGIVDIEKELGYLRSGIIGCCKGRYKTSHGFVWKYREAEDE